jgi:hypothetical protein
MAHATTMIGHGNCEIVFLDPKSTGGFCNRDHIAHAASKRGWIGGFTSAGSGQS